MWQGGGACPVDHAIQRQDGDLPWLNPKLEPHADVPCAPKCQVPVEVGNIRKQQITFMHGGRDPESK